jgi:hypothetical protein
MIFSDPEIHDRDKLRGDNTLGDMNDKESDIESKTQQRNAMILKMETDCLQEIVGQEKGAGVEN